MEDCNKGCKETERIETLVGEARQIAYSVCSEFRDIMRNKIYCPSPKDETTGTLQEPEPANKFDRIMLDLHRVINTLIEFKKKELLELEIELSKL